MAAPKMCNDGEHYRIDYFEVHGRTESLICMLNHAGVSYEKCGIPMAEWPAKKASFPNGVIPLVTCKDGTKMHESLAILKFFGMKYGYYSTDPMCIWLIEHHMMFLYDRFDKFSSIHFMQEDAKTENINQIFEKDLPSIMDHFEPYCKKMKWLASNDCLTIADFQFGMLYTDYLTNPLTYCPEKFKACLDKYPCIKAWG